MGQIDRNFTLTVRACWSDIVPSNVAPQTKKQNNRRTILSSKFMLSLEKEH